MKHNHHAFTIVELLIVIVIIGVLSAISVVAYSNISANARNAGRIQELKQWQKQFDLYRAQSGSYPAMSNGGYCLGTGFPVGGGSVRRCRDWKGTGAYSYQQSDNASLIAVLETISTIPSGIRASIGGGTIGPYVVYGDTTIDLYNVIEGTSVSNCPPGMLGTWTDGVAVECRIRLTK